MAAVRTCGRRRPDRWLETRHVARSDVFCFFPASSSPRASRATTSSRVGSPKVPTVVPRLEEQSCTHRIAIDYRFKNGRYVRVKCVMESVAEIRVPSVEWFQEEFDRAAAREADLECGVVGVPGREHPGGRAPLKEFLAGLCNGAFDAAARAEPVISPRSLVAMAAPGPRGSDPTTSTTRASATLRPSSSHSARPRREHLSRRRLPVAYARRKRRTRNRRRTMVARMGMAFCRAASPAIAVRSSASDSVGAPSVVDR